MKILPYGLLALTLFAIVAPVMAFAESENEGNEIGDIQEKQASGIATHSEQDSNENEHSMNPESSGLILFVTIAAIASVVGYSTWKIYKAKRKATAKSLV